MAMHIVTQSIKFIKPVTRTPPTLGQYKLGFIDEIAPANNTGVVLFFSSNDVYQKHTSNFVTQLENSLEKVLTRFYPLAGRYLQDIHVVDCNDKGVEFIQAKVNVKLETIIRPEVNVKLVDEFIPAAIGAVDQVTDPLVVIKVTVFECGGVALGVSISHRIADASTICTFLNEWASISREPNVFKNIGTTGFNSSFIFPPRGLLPIAQGFPRSKSEHVVSKYVTKKLSFSDSEISHMKEEIILKTNQQWSKVQLVSTIISKALIDIDRRRHDYPRDSVLLRSINLRGMLTQSSIPKDSCGNLSAILVIECSSSVGATTEALGDLLRDNLKSFMSCYLKVGYDSEELQARLLNYFSYITTIPKTTNVISLNSWCNFPFYEVDFGFGKPIMVNCGSIPIKNSVFLIDGVGGKGIEAYIGMEEEDVPYIEEALSIRAAFPA